MDCRKFKELLDSYLCDELAVETNHDVLRHAELCPPCRGEMAARRTLRSTLRACVKTTTASPDFRNRLRERLRAEVKTETNKGFFSKWLGHLALPKFALAAAVCSLVIVGVVYFFSPSTSVVAAELSPQLLQQASGDHQDCAAIWRQQLYRANDPVIGAASYDPTLQNLGQYSEHEALGLTFHYAHVCGHYGRQYAHLVYSRGADLVSLFVTERDAAAMKNGFVPPDDGLQHGLQQFQDIQEKFSVSAYQTSKHVVLIVSTLAVQENSVIAEKLAQPISLHLRVIENKN
jgi:hypothetical protein